MASRAGCNLMLFDAIVVFWMFYVILFFLLCVCKFHYFRGKTSSKLLVKHVSGRGLKGLSVRLAHGMSPYVSIRFDWSTGLQSCYIAVQQLRQFLTHFVVTPLVLLTLTPLTSESPQSFARPEPEPAEEKRVAPVAFAAQTHSNIFKHLARHVDVAFICIYGIRMH